MLRLFIDHSKPIQDLIVRYPAKRQPENSAMSKVQLLILGSHTDTIQNVSAFLKLNGYQNVKAVFSDEDALRELATGKYSVLIIGAGIASPSRTMLRKFLSTQKLSTRIIEHYGNPASLPADIRQATGRS